MKILVTGAAGFIGFHLVKKLAGRGDEVVGLDNINDYYDINLKFARLKETGIEKCLIEYGRAVNSSLYPDYKFIKLNLEDREGINALFKKEKFEAVCNLAAQAGVRYSLINPGAYVDSNISGFVNIAEASRHNGIGHLVYASSSSVYGLNGRMPFSASDNVDHPISLYAASKKANELMAHTYSYLFNLPTTGLRFFTVYGPYGRPDMALFLFTRAIIENKPIQVYNYGDMKRDFTYIDDIIEGVARLIDRPAAKNEKWDGERPEPQTSCAPYRIYNIGNGRPVKLLDFIEAIEETLGRKAVKNMLEMQPGDVYATWADVESLVKDIGYRPDTGIKDGIKKFIEWYIKFYGVKL